MNKIIIPWGAWCWPSGEWVATLDLDMTPDEQHADNLANGYSCEHRYKPSWCPTCNKPDFDKNGKL